MQWAAFRFGLHIVYRDSEKKNKPMCPAPRHQPGRHEHKREETASGVGRHSLSEELNLDSSGKFLFSTALFWDGAGKAYVSSEPRRRWETVSYLLFREVEWVGGVEQPWKSPSSPVQDVACQGSWKLSFKLYSCSTCKVARAPGHSCSPTQVRTLGWI